MYICPDKFSVNVHELEVGGKKRGSVSIQFPIFVKGKEFLRCN